LCLTFRLFDLLLLLLVFLLLEQPVLLAAYLPFDFLLCDRGDALSSVLTTTWTVGTVGTALVKQAESHQVVKLSSPTILAGKH
jgi:hypothetical protein